jgi:hypothetical protein
MAALETAFLRLGAQTLALGLDGEFVPPKTEKVIRRQAVRFKELIPWMANLREGAAQEVYEDRAAKLLEIAENIETAARKADYGTLAYRLADARAVCAACHKIFQEADSTGTLPRLPSK